jgi:hypothetical protein
MGRVSAPVPLLPPSWLLIVVLSLLVGTLTHLDWDAFTHEGGMVVKRAPRLHATLLATFGIRVEDYEVLQHGSTLCGLVLLAYWSLRWLRQ